ncbi:MAG: TetR-like C-terminal domain-containing protein [Acidimicrobiales bacterium]
MTRIRLDTAGLTAAAIDLVDRRGFDELSLSAVASGLGVGPSALYTHVDGLSGLRELVASEATRGLTHAVRNAAIGTSGDDALRAVGHAYRDFAEMFPGRFLAMVNVAGTGAAISEARAELDEVFQLIYLARGVADAAPTSRNARGALHGFLVLHHTGGGPHTDDDFTALLDMLCAAR